MPEKYLENDAQELNESIYFTRLVPSNNDYGYNYNINLNPIQCLHLRFLVEVKMTIS